MFLKNFSQIHSLVYNMIRKWGLSSGLFKSMNAKSNIVLIIHFLLLTCLALLRYILHFLLKKIFFLLYLILKTYLFIWPREILAAACTIFSCGVWDLVPRPGIEPGYPAFGVWSVSHWTIRKVPCTLHFHFIQFVHNASQTQEASIHYTGLLAFQSLAYS